MESKTISQSEHNEACMLWRAGDVPVLETVSEASKDIYITAVRFRSRSEWKALKAVIEPIEKLERGHETRLLLAVRDFPLFATVMGAHYDGVSEVERSMKFKALQCDPQLMDLRESFRDLEVNYASLRLRTNGTIALFAETPEFVRRCTGEFRDIYAHYGLVPLARDGFGITIGRVVQYSTNEWLRKKLVEGLDFYLRYDLANKGLPLVTGNETVSGCLYDFLA